MPKEWTYDQVVTLCEIDGVPLPEEFVEWMAEKLTMAANRAWDDDAPSAAEQNLVDESNGAWAAFEKSPHADMSNRDDLWPVWKDAWNAASAPSVADEPFPYQKTFDAIAAATTGYGSGHVGISVIKFREAFGAAPSVAAPTSISTKNIDVECTRVVDEEFWNLTYAPSAADAAGAGEVYRKALEEIIKNDPFNQSSAGVIARAAIAKESGND